MRRAILNVLRCPRCRLGGLASDAAGPQLHFGPVHCERCQSAFPVEEGLVDLTDGRASSSVAQAGYENPWVARGYERYLRRGLQGLFSKARADRDNELTLYRSLLGKPSAPVLDLACGTGLFARGLAQEPGMAPLVAMDLSRSMLEEGIAQAREHGASVDFIRASAPALPFLDGSLGGVLQAAALHFIADLDALAQELGRVLMPGGVFVASTLLPRRYSPRQALKLAGFFPRDEETLRLALTRAGLRDFERVLLPPFLVVRAIQPR